MPSDENAQKKPAFQVIEGQGGKPADTRPPVARFGRHTLPEAVIVIRRFVAQYGAPRTFEAPVDAPSRTADPKTRWPSILLTALVACILTALLGFSYLRFGSSRHERVVQVKQAEPAPQPGPSLNTSMTTQPAPIPSTSPATRVQGTASAVVPHVNRPSERVLRHQQRNAVPKLKAEPTYRSDY